MMGHSVKYFGIRLAISLLVMIVAALSRAGRAVRCAFCGLRFRHVSFQWTVDNQEVHLCVSCHRKMERNEHQQALYPGAVVPTPEIRYPYRGRSEKPSTGSSHRRYHFGATALMLGSMLVAALVFRATTRDDARTDAPASPPSAAGTTSATPSTLPGNLAVEMDTRPPEVREKAAKEAQQKKELGAKIEESKKRAVVAFPALAVAGSPLNKAFLARYHEYQQSKPAFFEAADWPYLLARECAKK